VARCTAVAFLGDDVNFPHLFLSLTNRTRLYLHRYSGKKKYKAKILGDHRPGGGKNKNNKLGRLDWDISMGRRTATRIPNDAFMIHIWCGEKTFFFAPPLRNTSSSANRS
jgi:hypothetical protein